MPIYMQKTKSDTQISDKNNDMIFLKSPTTLKPCFWAIFAR